MQKIFLETHDDNLITEIQNKLPDYQVVHLTSAKELSRMEHLREASYGSVLYSSNPSTRHYPMCIGSYVSLDAIEPALNYSLGRVENISDGLMTNYLGPVQVYPRDLIILANKKGWEEEAERVVEVLPDNFWTTVGFATVNNADKLSELYRDVFYYTTFLAGDSSSKSKLSLSNVEFFDISDLPRNIDSGLTIRELTRRAELWETLDIDTEFKREG